MQAQGVPITIFWSWQSDSPARTNRNFIEKALQKASKAVAKELATVISVDRDTRNVGGSPAIVDTILAKIRAVDVFVWDATLVAMQPKPAPNPNVLFELGYAFAVLGQGRIIGVMNGCGVPKDAELPFDLNHRRWPIRYELAEGSDEEAERMAQLDLVETLKVALKNALKEPRSGALHADVDFHAAKALWRRISSEWVRSWRESQLNGPQYEHRETLDLLSEYIRIADQPEFQFEDDSLKVSHGAVQEAFENYLGVSATERVPKDNNFKLYVISVKADGGYSDDYDARYDYQVKQIRAAVESVWTAWSRYVMDLRARYPELTNHGTA